MDNIDKKDTAHVENIDGVTDAAADYTDATVHITPEENKRLRKLINKQ